MFSYNIFNVVAAVFFYWLARVVRRILNSRRVRVLVDLVTLTPLAEEPSKDAKAQGHEDEESII